MIRIFMIIGLLTSQLAIGQTEKDGSCVLQMDIPNRLTMISAGDKEIVYRDKKTNAILTFTKAGVTEYGFDLNFTADRIFEELSSDPNYKDTKLNAHQLDVTDCYVLNWAFSKDAPNRKNGHQVMAIMDVCGQYYTFELSLPVKKKEEMIPIFDNILASIQTNNL